MDFIKNCYQNCYKISEDLWMANTFVLEFLVLLPRSLFPGLSGSFLLSCRFEETPKFRFHSYLLHIWFCLITLPWKPIYFDSLSFLSSLHKVAFSCANILSWHLSGFHGISIISCPMRIILVSFFVSILCELFGTQIPQFSSHSTRLLWDRFSNGGESKNQID